MKWEFVPVKDWESNMKVESERRVTTNKSSPCNKKNNLFFLSFFFLNFEKKKFFKSIFLKKYFIELSNLFKIHKFVQDTEKFKLFRDSPSSF